MYPELVNQFRTLWTNSDSPPDVFVFLDEHDESELSQKLAVLLQDQQFRWQTGSPLMVEDYLARIPELASDPDIKLTLAVGEFQARRDVDSSPSVGEFTARFADISDTLRSKLSELSPGDISDALQLEATITRSFDSGSTVANDQIGRYRLVRVLGQGAFGRVHLAIDEELQRQVAVKVPTPDRFHKLEDAKTYLAEARTVASLDHPNIVPVHDIGRTDDGSIYVVSKFIEGRTLRDWIKDDRPSHEESARLLAVVAEALQHAHRRRLIHRDVKPGNILIEDSTGTPYVTDFGLAVREEDYLGCGSIAGTPAYMSPEQARGEGHRLDGRSDIFSLGVVFYELLTGSKPFRGSTTNELVHQIVSVDPPPPRELDQSIPSELERICLKSLAKRSSDRYTTAAELADDLLHWRHGPEQARPELKVVPKGLRSFGADDADFFLELLPGPRDREGLPDSIRFWKTRIEETDPDKTFSVGLMYGPSGCGKSSLVKAGLIPRLSKDVVAVYIEATAEETEARILRGLRKKLPDLPGDLGLVETFALLRRGERCKVVIVLDQLEQWLHAHRTEQQTELVNALRQCDGGRLQAVVMVRDDFSMAASRFMRELENRILEGRNFATVDLFDVDHARRVLTKFGQAFGKLPLQLSNLTDQEREFVDRVAAGLANDGKVVCVRLALFAEMVKGRPWVPATLEDVGGTEGVGVNFLEETFSSRDANPDHRVHRQAACEVLKALLPEVGMDMKGHMQSHAELLDASGYQHRPAEFNDLLRILDGELRLITPTDPESVETASDGDPGSKHYQLTHDYLVPSLREWLTRKQRETRRGRAELRLAERAAFWNARPENRHLPSVWEHLTIVGLTSRRNWTEPQRRMMKKAARVRGVRCFVAFVLILALFAGIVVTRNHVAESQNRARVNGLIEQLFVADMAAVPGIVASLAQNPERSIPRLEEVADDPGRPDADRLRATFALAERPGDRASRLIEFALSSDLPTLRAIRHRLSPFADALTDDLWAAARRDTSAPSSQLRAATLLAAADAAGDDWGQIAPAVVNALLAENTLDLDAWVELLRPVAPTLIPRLRDRFSDTTATSTERVTAARVLARYANATLLSELLLEADAQQFAMLFPATSQHRDAVVDAVRKVLEKRNDLSTVDERILRARRWRNAAVTLFRLEPSDHIEPVLSASSDPTARSSLILEMRDFSVPPATLLKALGTWSDPSARQAVLLAIAPYRDKELTPEMERTLVDQLVDLLQSGTHQAERSAAEWLLRSWDREDTVANVIKELPKTSSPPEDPACEWWMTSEGHTMTIVRAPVTFDMGSPTGEPGREHIETRTRTTIAHSFAVSVHEVTMQQYQRFEPNAGFALDVADDPRCPANRVSFVDAMRYCRWLSELEKVPEDQICYPPLSEIGPSDAMLSEQRLSRTGYRLLTEEEWEYVCRAGSTTRWFSGASEEHLRQFAWFALSAREHLHPAGLSRPNAFGLFDIIGNVAEWCHPIADGRQYALRGGSYDGPARRVRSAQRYYPSNTAYSYTGLRIARTIVFDR